MAHSLFHPQVGYLQTLPRLVADIGLLLPFELGTGSVRGSGGCGAGAPPPSSSPVVGMPVPSPTIASVYCSAPSTLSFRTRSRSTPTSLDTPVAFGRLWPSWSFWPHDFGAVEGIRHGGHSVVRAHRPFRGEHRHRRRHFLRLPPARWTLVLGCIGIVAGLAQAIAYLSSPRTAAGPLGVTGGRLVEIIGGRVVANTVLGSASTTSKEFTSHLFAFSLAPLVVAVVIVGVAVWKGPLELKLFNLFGFLELAAALGSPLASLHAPQWPILAHTSGVRYWEFPSLAFMADVVWAVGQWRWRVLTVLSAIVLIALASFGVREDFRYRTFTAPSWAAQVRRFDALAPGRPFTFRSVRGGR